MEIESFFSIPWSWSVPRLKRKESKFPWNTRGDGGDRFALRFYGTPRIALEDDYVLWFLRIPATVTDRDA